MTAVASLPTPFNGVWYRSRLEARWAMFFQLLDSKALYEFESFDLDGTPYVPDFWMPEVKTLDTRGADEEGVYVEIKPTTPTDEENRKCALLSNATNKRVVLLYGEPGWWIPQRWNRNHVGADCFFPGDGWDNLFLPCEAVPTHAEAGTSRVVLGFEHEGRGERIRGPIDSKYYTAETEAISVIADRVNAYRFDLGRQR